MRKELHELTQMGLGLFLADCHNNGELHPALDSETATIS